MSILSKDVFGKQRVTGSTAVAATVDEEGSGSLVLQEQEQQQHLLQLHQHQQSTMQEHQQSSLESFDEHAPLQTIGDLRRKTLADAEEEMEALSRVVSADANASSTATTTAIATSTTALDALTDSSRPRRAVKAMYVDVMVDGVGLVKISKRHLEESKEELAALEAAALRKNSSSSSSSSSSIIEKRASAARQKHHQSSHHQLLYLSNSGRQVAGRDYEHQDVCQECWDGGDLLVCDLCPMAFHLECLGLAKLPSGSTWACPHHHCSTCGRRTGAAALLFRCECCSSAYCEDCLPAEVVVQGESSRLEALGHRIPSNACYILCSVACKLFFDKEIADSSISSTASLAPHQLIELPEYVLPDSASSSSIPAGEDHQHHIQQGDGVVGSMTETRGGGRRDATDRSSTTTTNTTATTTMPSRLVTSVNINSAQSMDYALGNCALSDIRERLGTVRTAVL
jgi:hypothetical protein